MVDQNVLHAANKVNDAASFIEFLEALRVDWERAMVKEKQISSDPYSSMHGWGNTNIGSFLDAAIAGGKDNKISVEEASLNHQTAWVQAA